MIGTKATIGPVHAECLAQCDNKEGSLQTYHGTYTTGLPNKRVTTSPLLNDLLETIDRVRKEAISTL